MANGTRKTANDKYRAEILAKITTLFTEMDENVKQIASNAIAFPFVNELREDEWIKITVSVPDGDRQTKEPFDGFEQAEVYAEKVANNVIIAEKKAKEKAAKILRDQKKREIAKKGGN